MALIGIAACRKLEDYRQAVLHVGGDVRILEPSMTVDAALDGVDGLLLTGGDDVAPVRYGEAPHPATKDAEAGRDEFEIALVKAARTRQLPIFAICRGIQVLNVACGGTLVQDIPSEIHGALNHSLTVPPHQSYELAHEVWLEKESLLTKLLEEPRPVDTGRSDAVGSQGRREGVQGDRDGARRCHRGDRGSISALLPRRAVAPGELLAHRRIPAAVRGIPGSGYRSNTITVSTCGVFGNRSNASARAIRNPASRMRRASRAIVATSHDT